MAGERAEFAATMDLKQVDAALAKTREQLNGALGGTSALAGNLGTLEEAGKKVQRTMGPAAGAINGLSAAMGDGSSKAGKFIAAGGQLAAAFAMGGPVGLGIAAGVIVVGQVSSALNDASASAGVFTEAVSSMNVRVIDMTRASIQPSRDAVKALATELRNFGKDTRQIMIDDAQFAVAFMDTRTANLERNRLEAVAKRASFVAKMGVGPNGEIGAAQASATEGVRTQDAVISSIDSRAKALNTTLVEQRTLLDDLTKMSLDLDAKGVEKARLGGPSAKLTGMSGTPGPTMAGEDFWAEQAKQHQAFLQKKETAEEKAAEVEERRIADQRVDLQLALDEEYDLRSAADRKKLDLAGETAEKLKTIEEQRTAATVQTLTDMTITIATLSGQMAGRVLTGQQDAMQQFLSDASVAAGGFVMLEGGKLVAQGIASTIAAPGNPQGLAMLGGGALLVGAGAAIQAGGPSAISAMLGGAGSGGGSGSSSSAARDPGVNRASRSGGGGTSDGGGFVLNVTFAGAGPAPEQVGESVSSALDTFHRRTGRGGAFNGQGPQIRR